MGRDYDTNEAEMGITYFEFNSSEGYRTVEKYIGVTPGKKYTVYFSYLMCAGNIKILYSDEINLHDINISDY